MSFIGQTARDVLGGMAELKFQMIMFGRDALYLEGVKPLRLDSDEMVFRARTFLVTLKGSGMTVKELADDCVSVIGKIGDIAVSDL